MSGNSGKVYYWDSCIYIALLKGEQSHGQAHVDSMAAIAKENRELKNTIITSVITLTEVLSSHLTQQQEEQFIKTFRATNHILFDVDYAVAIKARKFREAFLGHASGKKLHTPDAIHAATAVIQQVDEFHTFDDGQKEPKTFGLLELNGNALLDRLNICKPLVPIPPPNPQGTLFQHPQS